jgi:hypothetical protein
MACWRQAPAVGFHSRRAAAPPGRPSARAVRDTGFPGALGRSDASHSARKWDFTIRGSDGCPACDTAVLRIVRTPRWLRVDASGMSLLMIPESVSIS